MRINLKLLFPVLMLVTMQDVLAKTKYSSTIQTTVTSGKNNGTDETYVGLWLSGKANIGLTRHSMVSINLKAGGQNYDESLKDKTDIDLQANYIYQPSSGYFSPTYSLKLQIAQEDFWNSSNDKIAFSVSRYMPISNKMEYGLTYRFSQESGTQTTGSYDKDVQSLILNLDYFYNSKTILYTSLIIADEETSAIVTATANDGKNNVAAKVLEIAGGHEFGEPGYHGPAPTIGNHLSNSDNTSIFLGVVYSIDSKQSIDIAYIKHFYDKSDTGTSNSYLLALDYFYKF